MPEIKAGYQATPEQVANILKQGYIEGGIVGANTRLYGQVYGGGLYARQLVAPVRGSTGKKEYVYVSETAYQQARNLVPSYNPRTGTEPLRVIKTPERQYGTTTTPRTRTPQEIVPGELTQRGILQRSLVEQQRIKTGVQEVRFPTQASTREEILAKPTPGGYQTISGKTRTVIQAVPQPFIGLTPAFAGRVAAESPTGVEVITQVPIKPTPEGIYRPTLAPIARAAYLPQQKSPITLKKIEETPTLISLEKKEATEQYKIQPSISEYKPSKVPFGFRTSQKFLEKGEKAQFELARERSQGKFSLLTSSKAFAYGAVGGALTLGGAIIRPDIAIKGFYHFLTNPREELYAFGEALKTKPELTVGQVFGQVAAGEGLGIVTKPAVSKVITEYKTYKLGRTLPAAERQSFYDILAVAKGIKGEKAAVEKPVSFKIPERTRPVAKIVETTIKEELPESVVFGSTVVPSQTKVPVEQFLGRKIMDVDLFVENPELASQVFGKRLKKYGYTVAEEGTGIVTKEGKHALDIKTFKTSAEEIQAMPPSEIPGETPLSNVWENLRTIEPGGVKQVTLEQQGVAKLASISGVKEGKLGPPPHRAWKDINDAFKISGELLSEAEKKPSYNPFRKARIKKAKSALARLRETEPFKEVLEKPALKEKSVSRVSFRGLERESVLSKVVRKSSIRGVSGAFSVSVSAGRSRLPSSFSGLYGSVSPFRVPSKVSGVSGIPSKPVYPSPSASPSVSSISSPSVSPAPSVSPSFPSISPSLKPYSYRYGYEYPSLVVPTPKVLPVVPPFGRRELGKGVVKRKPLRKRYAPSLYGSTFAVKQARRGGTFTGFEIRGLTQKQARKVWAGF